MKIFSTRLPIALIKLLKRKALEEDITVQALVKKALENVTADR